MGGFHPTDLGFSSMTEADLDRIALEHAGVVGSIGGGYAVRSGQGYSGQFELSLIFLHHAVDHCTLTTQTTIGKTAVRRCRVQLRLPIRLYSRHGLSVSLLLRA